LGGGRFRVDDVEPPGANRLIVETPERDWRGNVAVS